MLVRTQIMLEEEKWRKLKRMAKKKGKSISALVRESVDHYLEEQQRIEDEKFIALLKQWQQVRESMPLYEGDLVDEMRQERAHEMEEWWKPLS